MKNFDKITKKRLDLNSKMWYCVHCLSKMNIKKQQGKRL